MNCEAERQELLSQIPTISIWDSIRASTEMYLNPLFNSDWEAPMIPVCRVRLMQLWTSQYQKVRRGSIYIYLSLDLSRFCRSLFQLAKNRK
jgi:hypothetical protein